MLIAAVLEDWCLFYDSIWCWLIGFGHWLNFISRGTVILLAMMLVLELIVLLERARVFFTARYSSRKFVACLGPLLEAAKLDAASVLARENKQSHIARVLAAGLKAFLFSPRSFPRREAIEMAQHAMEREKCRVHLELECGLGALKSIVATAPFLGMLGTTLGIFGAFGGIAESKATAFRYITFTLGESLIPSAIGLFVSITAVWLRNYFCERLEVFDTEMSNASLELVSYLNARDDSVRSVNEQQGEIFAVWNRPYDLQRLLLLAVGFCGLYLLYWFSAAMYYSLTWERRYAAAHASEIQRNIWDNQQFPEQIAVSPDRRRRAEIRALYRNRLHHNDENRESWYCGWAPYGVPALTVYPNDGTIKYHELSCNGARYYSLSQYVVLWTHNCNRLNATWRSSEELVVQCLDCTGDDIVIRKGAQHPRITLIGPDEKKLRAQRIRIDENRCPPVDP